MEEIIDTHIKASEVCKKAKQAFETCAVQLKYTCPVQSSVYK